MRTGLEVHEAQDAILAATPILGKETTATRDALGRVLAEPVFSGRTLPPDDCSAMDGYAVRRADLRGASAESAVELELAFEIAAGARPEREIRAGEAARIFTGAALPPGADAVVRQEDTEVDAARVRFLVEPEPREHVRDAGEDLKSTSVYGQ